jgi:hypothetical protein
MSKQTSVEWILQKILIENGIVNSDIEQAYKMHELEITEAFEDGNEQGFICKTGEEYYNETYKKEEK